MGQMIDICDPLRVVLMGQQKGKMTKVESGGGR